MTGGDEPNESRVDAAGDEPDVSVHRRPRGDDSGSRKLVGALALGALVAVGFLAWWSPWSVDPAAPEPVAATSSTTLTTTIVSTSGPIAPLTGQPVSESDAVALLRPALVSKIDGAREAMPQKGLDSADMVIEVRVEGISRYLGVWHSAAENLVGPVRSARTTDPDLLALFGEPLFSYSGGNPVVLSKLRRSDWFVDVSHDAVPPAYTRQPERVAPHDLMADAAALWERSPEQLVVPPAQFAYRAEGEVPAGDPAPGVAVSVGSDARFAWDAELGGWRRWAYDIAHENPGGESLAPTNVVVLEVGYRRSAADTASPEAVSVGDGAAWVYSEGVVQPGIWTRRERSSTWDLRDGAGEQMTLSPGTTWVVLADAPPITLGVEQAESLIAQASAEEPG